MTFQAYIDNIKEKTGLDPADFRRLADEKGFLDPGTKTSTIIDWLTSEFGLGKGHGMAIVSTFSKRPKSSDLVEAQFAGNKSRWRETFDALLAKTKEFGPVDISPTSTYISLLKGTGKFAIVAFTGDRMDVGIKLKDAATTDRFEPSGNFNAMVTHRVRITDPAQVDAELLDWLRRAYDAA
jgi:Domain of unknown function (DUF5655)/Domain of unknown function (DUF4287)